MKRSPLPDDLFNVNNRCHAKRGNLVQLRLVRSVVRNDEVHGGESVRFKVEVSHHRPLKRAADVMLYAWVVTPAEDCVLVALLTAREGVGVTAALAVAAARENKVVANEEDH
jgi:hypothetical protein